MDRQQKEGPGKTSRSSTGTWSCPVLKKNYRHFEKRRRLGWGESEASAQLPPKDKKEKIVQLKYTYRIIKKLGDFVVFYVGLICI